MKTLGKLLEEKICPEGISAIVLFAETMLKENNLREYFFTTQTDGVTTAKSPMGMFPFKIPNDLKLVSDRIDEYYQGVKLKDSKISFNIGVVS